ncbi:MAG: helix-turn-helix domain-containing protein [Verrucomicrobiales bacterium]|nr:helix-turn-helix domain-containing protein [Verrucomicrobiales bacterium]
MNFPKFYRIPEVAKILRASEKTVRRRISSGKLKARKEGGRLLISEAEVHRYLEGLNGGGLLE